MKDLNFFHFKAAQNLVAEHYERNFDTIFHFKAAQNLVAKYIIFGHEYPLYSGSKLVCRAL